MQEPWPRGYKTSLMLNSAELELFPAHKCCNANISTFIRRETNILGLSEPENA